MKITLVSHSAGVNAGAEKSLIEIARYLSLKGDDVSVVTPKHGPLINLLSKMGIECNVIPYRWSNSEDSTLNSLAQFDRIYSYLKETRPDIILTNTAVIPWFGFMSKYLNVPHAWFLREIVDSKFNTIEYYPGVEETIRFIEDNSDVVFVNSRFTQEYYLSKANFNKTTIVYPTFASSKEYFNKKINKDNTVPKLIVFSSISPQKNQLEVVKAVKVLSTLTSTKFNLTILGPVGLQSYYDEIVDYINTNKLNSLVTISPPVNNPYSVVSKNDIAITPSIDEPFGRVTIEAAALGCLVIASDSGGNLEIHDKSNIDLYRLGDPEDLAHKLLFYINNRDALSKRSKEIKSKVYDSFIKKDNLQELRKSLLTLIDSHNNNLLNENWVMNKIFKELEERVSLIHRYNDLNSSLDTLSKHNHNQEIELHNLHNEINTIKESKAWKIIQALNKFRP